MSFSSVGDFEIQEDFVQYLSARYFSNDYCTWLDLVLISINPLKKLHVTENINNALKKALKGESLIGTNVPHIYSVVHRALCYLSVNRQDQIIVFSGDSGSGKSHAAEEALNFIADVDTPLNQICHAQTLLSCFGNAATEYHGNSSRFGNLLLLNYSELSKTILKARILTYLLEKTRVSSPSVRNFHVFYQLIVACKSTGQDGLYLNTDRNFRILPGQFTADDENGYKKMFKAFAGLDFDWPTIKSIFEVISGILHLGNIVFKSSEESGFHAEVNWEESYDDLQRACELLGFESEMLALILTNSLISFDKHESRTIQIPVTSTRDATTRRDALMKLLYSLLFNWIVSYINNKFDRGDALTTFKLGLLDIYGFEMLSRNSLEQLCINYANERLHNYFVQDILVQKKKILEAEGILSELNLINMEEDYSKKAIARINLLDATNSIFSVLNEGSLLIHHCEGKEVCHKLENLPENDLIKVDRYNEKFVIKHFAGNVTYNSNHMVEKNSDKVPNELINILLNSSKEFVIKLVAEDSSHTLKHTVLGKFKRSLDLLMLELKNAEVHYVRCIKPNVQMKPGLIDKQFFEKQLRSSGVTEAVKLCGHCLPVRLNLERFCSHFGCLMNRGEVMNDDIDKLNCFKKWADDLELNYQIGDGENIFLEEIVFKDLENKVQFLKRHSSRIIQKAWLRYRHKTCNSVLPSSSIVQKYSCLRQLDLGELEETNNYSVRLVLNSDIGRLQCSEDLIDEMNRSSELQRLLSLQSSCSRNMESGTIVELVEDESFPTNQNHLPALPAPRNSEQVQIQNPFDYGEIGAFSSSVVCEPSDSHNPQIPQMNCDPFDYDEIYTFPSSVVCEPSDSYNPQIPQMNSSRNISSELKEYRLTGKLKKKEVSNISSNQYNYKLLRKIVTSEKRVGTEVFFMSNTGIVSRRALAKVPIWFHTKKTCIPYSHIVPFVLLPLGIEDAFE